MRHLFYKNVLFLTCPTGTYCREDRCQSFFNFELIPGMRPPLEECEAAGALKNLGCKSKIIDAPALKISHEKLILLVTDYKPDLVIFAVTFGSLEEDLKWAKRLKELLPGVDFGLRGAPCYVLSEKILSQNKFINFTTFGDYELVFDEIARHGYKEASGTAYICENGFKSNKKPFAENPDLLPFPDRSGIDQSLYTVRGSRKPQATIRVQRGCPFPCTYCLVHTVSGNTARHRSASSIVAEMRGLMSGGINHFYLRAETFTIDNNWALEVCSAIREFCPGAKWVTTTRAECVNEEILKAMRDAGCYGISFGVDVASKEIGKNVKKHPRPEQARSVMRICDKLNLMSLAYFMVGFIWDTEETLRETSDAIKLIRPDLITIHYAHPYPGTVYYDQVSNSGFKAVSSRAQAEPAFALNTISTSRLRSFGRKTLLFHYLNLRVVFSVLRKLLIMKFFKASEIGNKKNTALNSGNDIDRHAA